MIFFHTVCNAYFETNWYSISPFIYRIEFKSKSTWRRDRMHNLSHTLIDSKII